MEAWRLGNKIKQAVLILISLLFLFPLPAESTSIAEFKARAEELKARIQKIESRFDRAQRRYHRAAVQIEALKEKKRPDNFFGSMFYDYRLKLMLGRGSNAAYRYDKTEKQLADARDEYFTYALVIIDGLNEGIRKCINEKCGELEKLFPEREQWISVIDYDSMLAFEYNERDDIQAAAGAEKEDALLYYEKKLVQADQRIHLISEELALLDSIRRLNMPIDEARYRRLESKLDAIKEARKAISAKITPM